MEAGAPSTRHETAEFRRQIANSYLEHIAIALKVQDQGAPFRDFFDNWYANRIGEGHLTRSGRPIWFNHPDARTHQQALSRMHFVSRAARRILERAESGPKDYSERRNRKDFGVRLMVDHAVPIGVLVKMMMCRDSGIRTPETISAFLVKFYRLGVITHGENDLLNGPSHRLQKRMPYNWDEEDVFARYRVAKIEE